MLNESMLNESNAAYLAGEFLGSIPACPKLVHGRGIGICAGGAKYAVCAWVAINVLRKLGCTLPIEVWYRGEDEGDPNWLALVKVLGVECVDAYAVRQRDPHPRLGGWELKPYAILHSRFREILFLDADNVLVFNIIRNLESIRRQRPGY